MIWSKIFGKNDSDDETVIESFLSVVIKRDMEIDELAKLYSAKLDEIIRKEISNNLSYVGGTFNISYLDEKAFELSFELFFQDAEKDWVKKESKSTPQPISYLTENAVKELRAEKVISFEVDPPKIQEPLKTKKVQPKVRKMPGKDS